VLGLAGLAACGNRHRFIETALLRQAHRATRRLDRIVALVIFE
jgi:hypothetical protein